MYREMELGTPQAILKIIQTAVGGRCCTQNSQGTGWN